MISSLLASHHSCMCFVVIFELSILAFCKGKPDVTELLVARTQLGTS